MTLAFTALLFFAAQASAATKPFGVESISPADGATVAPSSPLPVTLVSNQAAAAWSGPYYPGLMWVELATAPTLGQDGTLASEFTIGTSTLTRGDAFPSNFSGSILTYPVLTPGTYYWQAHYTVLETAPMLVETNTYTSPVFRIVVGAPQTQAPPPSSVSGGSPWMTRNQAIRHARAIIRDETGQKAHGFKRNCRRRGDVTFECRVSWRTTRRGRPWTYFYAGTLQFDDDGEYINYSFRGLRARNSCLSRKSVERCARRVRW